MPLDATLSQVLSELYASHARIDQLQQRVQQLEAEKQQAAPVFEGLPPGWRLVREVPTSG